MSKVYTERPSAKGARVAWDAFSRVHDGAAPDKMWFAHLTYPVWVAQYGDEYDEWDNLALRHERKAS